MSNNYHYLFKFVVAGDAAVGKSTLIQQFTEQSYQNAYVPTQRIHFASRTIPVNELQVKCQLWDIKQPADPEKQDNFTGLNDSLCKKAAAVLLLFDLTNKASFEGLERWVQDIRLKCEENISIVLVGNKSDKEERAVSQEEAQEFSRQANISYLQVSSFDSKAVALLFERVVKEILDKIALQTEPSTISDLKSKIKRGKMEIQTPISPFGSSNEDRQKEKVWFEEVKTEDSDDMFLAIDKLAESLKKTCFLEEMVRKIKANIRQKGLYYLLQMKEQLESSRIGKSSSIVKDLFDIFSIIQECSSEQHITLSRISLENEELTKYKDVQAQITQDKQKIQELQRKIQVLAAQKSKLQQYKENSESREQNLLQMVDKIKKEKKSEIERNERLMGQLSKLEKQNMQLTREINRLKQEQEQLNMQKLIEARENNQIMDELQNLQGSGVDTNLLGKLRKKFSVSLSGSRQQISETNAII